MLVQKSLEKEPSGPTASIKCSYHGHTESEIKPDYIKSR